MRVSIVNRHGEKRRILTAQHFSPDTPIYFNNTFFEEEAFKSIVFSALPFPSRSRYFLPNAIFLSQDPVEVES
jgi:hypothetical protein